MFGFLKYVTAHTVFIYNPTVHILASVCHLLTYNFIPEFGSPAKVYIVMYYKCVLVHLCAGMWKLTDTLKQSEVLGVAQ
jgi:hypothetical protein